MKKLKLTAFLLLGSLAAQAQQFQDGIDQATAELTKWIEPIQKLLWVLAVIVAIFGSFKIYSKIQAGDQDVGKSIGQWAFGFVFLVTAGFLVKAMFL